METDKDSYKELNVLLAFQENVNATNDIISERYDELKGKYIAVCDRMIVASGSTEDEMQKNLPSIYRERLDVVSTYVRKPEDPRFCLFEAS